MQQSCEDVWETHSSVLTSKYIPRSLSCGGAARVGMRWLAGGLCIQRRRLHSLGPSCYQRTGRESRRNYIRARIDAATHAVYADCRTEQMRREGLPEHPAPECKRRWNVGEAFRQEAWRSAGPIATSGSKTPPVPPPGGAPPDSPRITASRQHHAGHVTSSLGCSATPTGMLCRGRSYGAFARTQVRALSALAKLRQA